ncbi:MAG: Gfo/Idh/MocA family oxidoreductase [Planctomycetes bacterium]|nr:Gfo/Idh/MocA family oxidoreductase [Planctomycetota bacterium]
MSRVRTTSTRRGFLSSASAGAGAALAAQLPGSADAAQDVPLLKIGLIGCGGRGTGAAIEALRADRRVELTALGDLFQDKLDASLSHIRKQIPNKVRVTAKTCFLGFDAYQRVLDSGVDVVLLAAPPAFRPQHLAAAVAAGKHSFCECTAAIDAPGIRSFLKSAELAGQKKLGILSGFCWRYSSPHRAVREQIEKGTIGDIRTIYATYYRPSLSLRYGGKRRPGWSDLEWQLRDWADFLWLSGDLSILLSGGHSVDKMSWWMGDVMPDKAVATGGKQCAGEGNTFDHATIVYEYANGVRGFLGVRSQDACHDENNDYIIGSRGICTIGRGPVPVITGPKPWRYTGPANNMYQTEHDEFFASLRRGKPINDGRRMAHTSLMAIMGRMAAYTGQEITWQMALNSKESLVPEQFDWKMKVPETPVAVPGRTKFV